MGYVLLLYQEASRDEAFRLRAKLEQAGLGVWLKDHLFDWQDTQNAQLLRTAVHACQGVVAVSSEPINPHSALYQELAELKKLNKPVYIAKDIQDAPRLLEKFVHLLTLSEEDSSPLPLPYDLSDTQEWSSARPRIPQRLWRRISVFIVAIAGISVLFLGILANQNSEQQRQLNAQQTATAQQIQLTLTALAQLSLTPLASATYTPSITPSHTPTPSATPTHTLTPSPTSSHTPTPTPTHTPTPSTTPSYTPTPSSTPTHTPTPSATPSYTATSSATSSYTPTLSTTPTDTPTLTATFRPPLTPTLRTVTTTAPPIFFTNTPYPVSEAEKTKAQ